MTSKIAYITDIHLDEDFPINQGIDTRKNWDIILNDVKSKGITSIIFGGDIGEKSSSAYFFDSLKSFDIAVSLGNHDDFNEVIKYDTTVSNTNKKAFYYTQNTSSYKFIFLDSSLNTIDDEQFIWFKNELITDKKIAIFIHHPILPVHTEVDRKYYLIHRDRLRLELERLSTKVTLFSGHYHFDDVQTYKNITQYITSAASYQIAKIPDGVKIETANFGYRILEFTEAGIETELILFDTK
ncbi:metallophosphoesterase family protein [Kordia sp.]|uniref:metallophosphoesterase family protein n=1 Tax=Kordia sp. TaxID=1965332 RepID=UPI003D6B9CFC